MSTNLYSDMQKYVVQALLTELPDLPPDIASRVEVTPTRDPAHGDMATNAALVAAKAAQRKPAEIAAVIVAALHARPDVAAAQAAGPGFVNITLTPETLLAQVPVILNGGDSYGDGTAGQGLRVNVEYVSANPTGPMHIGHCRGAVVGDALANLMKKAGFDVTKEFYINDSGAQVIALAWAAYWRYLQALGTTLTEEGYAAAQVPGGLQYRGDYLVADRRGNWRSAAWGGTCGPRCHRGPAGGHLARYGARFYHRPTMLASHSARIWRLWVWCRMYFPANASLAGIRRRGPHHRYAWRDKWPDL